VGMEDTEKGKGFRLRSIESLLCNEKQRLTQVVRGLDFLFGPWKREILVVK